MHSRTVDTEHYAEIDGGPDWIWGRRGEGLVTNCVCSASTDVDRRGEGLVTNCVCSASTGVDRYYTHTVQQNWKCYTQKYVV